MKNRFQITLLLSLFITLIVSDGFSNTQIALLRSQYTIKLWEESDWKPPYDTLSIAPAKLLLSELPYQYDMVTDQFIELDSLELMNYQLLIIPNAISMSYLECSKIENFVKNGGTVFITGNSGIHDTFDWVYGLMLSAAMGVRWPGYQREISEGSFWNMNILRCGDPQCDAVFKGVFEKKHPTEEDSSEADIVIKNGWEDGTVVPIYLRTAKLLAYWTNYNLDSLKIDPRGEGNLACAVTCNKFGNGHVIYFNGKLFSGYKYCREIAQWAHRDTNPCQNAEKIVFNVIRNFADIPKSNLELADWWIQRQHHHKSKLVDSYEDGDRDFGHNAAFLYDQALAIMAYCALAKHNPLQQKTYELLCNSIFKKIEFLQNGDGSFYFAWLHKDEPMAAINRARYSGANAWLLMAINRYEEQFGDSLTFRPMAADMANWLCTQLDTCKYHPNKGIGCQVIRGGINANDQQLPWLSIEHNLDAYSSLAYFGYLSHNTGYTKIAQDIRRCLETCAWEKNEGRFIRGLGDSMATMDVNPWGILAFGDTAWQGHELTRGLNWALEHCRTTHAWEGQWDPYPYLIGNVDGFDFNDDKDVVWVEGTESMALALQLVGQDSLANYFHNEMAKLIFAANDGGLPYSTNSGTIAADDTERSTTYPSVAGTAWFIFKELNYNPFEIPPAAHPEPDTHECKIEIHDLIKLNDYSLFPNYPNPFNQKTKICYQINKSGHAKLSIFNISGQLVRTLVDSQQAAGYHEIVWDGKDSNDEDIASGLYIYCLDYSNKKLLGKALLIK